MRNPVRSKNLRLRFLPAAFAAALCLLWFESWPVAIALGVASVLLGVAVRSWGAGCLVKREALTLGGPYAHVRHPLYAGSLLIALGFAVALGPSGWLLGAAGLLWFFAAYFPGKERRESQLLEGRYGVAYAHYRSRVPALMPALRAARKPTATAEAGARWSAAHYADNNEFGTALGVGAGLVLLALRAAVAG